MIRLGDGLEDRGEVGGELGVIADDLLLPDPGEQDHLMTIAVRDRGQDGFGIGHAAERAAAVGR
jgi:hypothetical protein